MSKPTKTQIREGMQWRERRRVMAVGRAKGDATRMARRCAWCQSWYSLEDERRAHEGARVTDGICEECEDKHFGDVR